MTIIKVHVDDSVIEVPVKDETRRVQQAEAIARTGFTYRENNGFITVPPNRIKRITFREPK